MDEGLQILVKKAAAGDSESFEMLIAKHEKMMYALALRMCQNPEDAKDCMQEAMIRIFRSLSGFRGESSFSTWVYRIVNNTCLDSHRRKKVRRAESLDEMSESGWNAPDTAAGPEESAENKELKRAISAAIDTLPVDIRTAVVLRDIQGFSYEDVSQIMNINIGTVKSRISRGRERLRELLSEYREQK